ncbi:MULTISPECIES: hypothetical protein [unclassified Bradyrhizobium]|nr:MULTISPECIES: hypothetical protein [unclassified Bradyrhizobium]
MSVPPMLPASGGSAPAPTQVDNSDSDPASPLAIGNYMMPRVGLASDYETSGNDASIPANARPTTGQIAPPAASSAAPNFFNRAADALASISHGGSLLGAVRGQYDDPRTQAAAQSNLTARALIAKGVDPQIAIAAVQPGNSEMLKTLVDQKFGAPKPPTALGSGYIYNPQTNKVERAYEPDDKIPVGFEKTDNGLRPIPGGPADPAYLRTAEAQKKDPNAPTVLGRGGEIVKTNPDGTVSVLHKNQEGGEATLSDDTVKAMASQYLAGDKTVLQNLGRGAQGAANIVKIREEISKQAHDAGLSAKDIVNTFNEQAGALAGQRTVGVRAANISLAANEANSMIPIALMASEKVPRSDWVPWNKMVQAYQTGTSSPELASFVAATNSLVNAYVRAVSPTGVPTDSMREHAYEMLNKAQGPEAYKAVIETMRKEMQAALSAPEHVRQSLRGESKPAEVNASAAPTAGAYVWTPDNGLQPK